MLWDGKFLQIDGDLAFRSIPQQIQVKVENIFLFLLMAGEDPSIIKYKFRDKNFQLAVSSMKVEVWNKAVLLSPSESHVMRERLLAIVRWKEERARECFLS
jgi:hypothetical protein